MSQLAFDFSVLPEYTAADFIVSPANQEAHLWIQQWPRWNSYGLVVYGPSGCGKTHSSHLWQERAGAMRLPVLALEDALAGNDVAFRCYVVENLEKLENEEALFHLLNQVKAGQGYILLTASHAPSHLHFALPDLRSRLQALPAVAIAAPDETLLKAVLMKQFADRQLRVGADVLDFLLLRMERSFAAAKYWVKRLDAEAMATGHNITIPLVRTVLKTAVA